MCRGLVKQKCPAAAVRQLNCSRFFDPRPQNSYHRAEYLFSRQWVTWHGQSEAVGVRSPCSVDHHRPAIEELDLIATYRQEWPACSQPAVSPEANADYEELARCDCIDWLLSESVSQRSRLTANAWTDCHWCHRAEHYSNQDGYSWHQYWYRW